MTTTPSPDLTQRWIQQYCAHMAPQLAIAALAHFNLAYQRVPGSVQLRVYNPVEDVDGWGSPHTIIEIVYDDLPFLADSIAMEINRQGLAVLELCQSVMDVQRDSEGRMLAVLNRKDANGQREALLHLQITRQTNGLVLKQLDSGLRRILNDIQLAVLDWQPMQEAMTKVRLEVAQHAEIAEYAEVAAFLEWLSDHHFTLLGYCAVNAQGAISATLGVLRQPEISVGEIFVGATCGHEPTPQLLVVTKANARSTVHRSVDMDLIVIRRFDSAGAVTGEYRFLGLYASRAYNCLPQDIPVVRQTMHQVVTQAALEPNSHAAKALQHVLETYPRDELFQIDNADLYRISSGILALGERQGPRLFLRRDRYERFVTCLVFIPRERYDTSTRQRIQEILRQTFQASAISFAVNLTEAPLARVLFLVRVAARIPIAGSLPARERGLKPTYDVQAIEARFAAAIRSWQDELQAALLARFGEMDGCVLFETYGAAFPAGYREDYPVQRAVSDIEQMQVLDEDGALRLELSADIQGQLRFRMYRRGLPLPLHQALPILENMAVHVEDERPYKIERRVADLPISSQQIERRCDAASTSPLPVWIHDFGLSHGSINDPNGDLQTRFQDAVAAIWQQRMANDGFNALIVRAGLDWRRVVLLRTYARYMRQTALTFSQSYMEEALAACPEIALLLVELFEARFNPQAPAQARTQRLTDSLQTALDAVTSLDQDRILRSFLAAIQATLRTNFYAWSVSAATVLALKFDSQQLSFLPEPKPLYEIFVYSPQVEGIHLRGGRVARGGLRWSDRREDYRTEVLGLMKAQMVKNAVIVPVGAKGGFVVQDPAEVVTGYQNFISGLLDLTDGCQPPRKLLRYDDEDPYLVVAADKGTASFSDTANEVAASYGFWLGDAFASGGRTGYDHKRMAITARGAWECVRQHLENLNIDYEHQPFSVVGIGDMSGDVFGNGLLWSQQIQLVAAFDHRHIFLDPQPDPEISFQERLRLFKLPKSSWADYNLSLISPGGGVYARKLKSIPLTPQVQAALGCAAKALTPADLVRAILRAPVDLLWNGGIGTYIKASWERHADVGDRINDSQRVDANELRCRSIGEGGNLGLTQAARIEYAQQGGRLDTDFIHNVGGVNCSDHEVNIKILLDQVVAAGELTLEQRNHLLAEMTEEIAALVLQDSYWQSCAISLDETRGAALLAEQARFIRNLEQAGRLNRALEGLPSDVELKQRQRQQQGLTRPEIAVLIAYAKHSLYEDLLASDLPEDRGLLPELERYFPTPLRTQFQVYIHKHPLRREILCTTIANRLVNRFGSTFIFRLQETIYSPVATMVRASAVTWEIFGLCRLWSLAPSLPATLRLELLSRAGRLVSRTCRRLMQLHGNLLTTQPLVVRYQTQVAVLMEHLELTQTTNSWGAMLDHLDTAIDLITIAEQTNTSIKDVVTVATHLAKLLQLDWLEQRINALSTHDRWRADARTGLRDELQMHRQALSGAILTHALPNSSVAARLELWQRCQHRILERYLQLVADLQTKKELDVAMLWVVIRALGSLTTQNCESSQAKG